jgi:hypothetical protein
VHQPAEADSYPMVAGQQAGKVLATLDAESSSGTGPANRLTGPYLQILSARRKQAAANKQPQPIPAAPSNTSLVIPAGSTGPRFFLAVGERAGQSTPALRLLVSSNARVPFALWADLVMLPGATLPAVAAPTQGAPVLAGTDGTGLVSSPADALSRYADMLTRGAASPDAAAFATNTFTTQVSAQQQKDSTSLAKVAAVTSTHTAAPAPAPIFAVRTADRGALVIGQLNQKVSIVLKPGAGTVKVDDPDVAALAGKSQFSKQVTRIATEVVALYLPPAGGGQIQVIAAEKADVAVAGT